MSNTEAIVFSSSDSLTTLQCIYYTTRVKLSFVYSYRNYIAIHTNENIDYSVLMFYFISHKTSTNILNLRKFPFSPNCYHRRRTRGGGGGAGLEHPLA